MEQATSQSFARPNGKSVCTIGSACVAAREWPCPCTFLHAGMWRNCYSYSVRRCCVGCTCAPLYPRKAEMPKRMETCAAADCGVRYLPTRSGCGGRQRVAQEYIDYASVLLKSGTVVGDWICVHHRDTLRHCVATTTSQPMVLTQRGTTLLTRVRLYMTAVTE